MLVKNGTDHPCPPSYSSTDYTWNAANEDDRLIYVKTEWSSLWEQEQQDHKKFAWWEHVGKNTVLLYVCF